MVILRAAGWSGCCACCLPPAPLPPGPPLRTPPPPRWPPVTLTGTAFTLPFAAPCFCTPPPTGFSPFFFAKPACEKVPPQSFSYITTLFVQLSGTSCAGIVMLQMITCPSARRPYLFFVRAVGLIASCNSTCLCTTSSTSCLPTALRRPLQDKYPCQPSFTCRLEKIFQILLRRTLGRSLFIKVG